jgi:uncharacterized integral membrane protein
MRLINWVLVLIALAIVVVVGVGNRDTVTFSFDPLPFVWDRPFYQFLYGSFFLGLLIGLLTEWWRARRWRREAKARRREVDALRQENAHLKAAAGSHPASAD